MPVLWKSSWHYKIKMPVLWRSSWTMLQGHDLLGSLESKSLFGRTAEAECCNADPRKTTQLPSGIGLLRPDCPKAIQYKCSHSVKNKTWIPRLRLAEIPLQDLMGLCAQRHSNIQWLQQRHRFIRVRPRQPVSGTFQSGSAFGNPGLMIYWPQKTKRINQQFAIQWKIKRCKTNSKPPVLGHLSNLVEIFAMPLASATGVLANTQQWLMTPTPVSFRAWLLGRCFNRSLRLRWLRWPFIKCLSWRKS